MHACVRAQVAGGLALRFCSVPMHARLQHQHCCPPSGAPCGRRENAVPQDTLLVRMESGDDAVVDNSFASEQV